MAGILLYSVPWIVPQESGPPTDKTVAANFERFDGLTQLDNAPSSDYPPGSPADPNDTGPGTADFGFNQPGHYPRPGQISQPAGQVYTPGPLSGLTNTLGGQPLPVQPWEYPQVPRGYTPARYPQTIQSRLGNGQNNQGVANTAFFSSLNANPPQPADTLDVLLGFG